MGVRRLRTGDIGIELDGPPPGSPGTLPIPIDPRPDPSQGLVGVGKIFIQLDGPQSRGPKLRTRLLGRRVAKLVADGPDKGATDVGWCIGGVLLWIAKTACY